MLSTSRTAMPVVALKANFCDAVVPLSKAGDVAVLVRDTARILRVALGTSGAVTALPWDPTLFSLAVNGVLYADGPVPLAVGDALEMCLPGSWTDAPFTFALAQGDFHEDAEEGSAADGTIVTTAEGLGEAHDVMLESPGKQGLRSPTTAPAAGTRTQEVNEDAPCKAGPNSPSFVKAHESEAARAAAAYAKWNNHYAFHYNNLTQFRQDALAGEATACPHHGRCPFSCNRTRDDTAALRQPPVHVLVTHLEASAEGEAPNMRNPPVRKPEDLGPWWGPGHRCCACPLLGHDGLVMGKEWSIGAHARTPDTAALKSSEGVETPWSQYAAPLLEQLAQQQHKGSQEKTGTATTAATEAAGTNATSSLDDAAVKAAAEAQLLALLRRAQSLEEVLAGTRYA